MDIIFDIVFPKSEDIPSFMFQAFIYLSISLHVSFDFMNPEVSVRPRGYTVEWASVPKAAIYKDSYSIFNKHDIWFSSNMVLDSIAESC